MKPVESHSLSMLIAELHSVPTGKTNYLGYIRHTSLYLGVAFMKPVESRRFSVLIDAPRSVSASKANASYFQSLKL